MALVSVNTYSTTNRRWGRAAITGEPNMRASHTMAVRVKHSSTATNYDSAILFYGNSGITSGSSVARINAATSTGCSHYRAAGSSGYAVRSTCYGNTTTWYHLTFVYNATTAFIRFYIDGTYIGQTASAAADATNATGDFFVAQHPGSFADAAFYGRALSDGEVADLAAYRNPQVTSGLLAYWPLDSDGSDISGNGMTSAQLGSAGTNLSFNGDAPPQPDDPPFDIAATGSASTSGTANPTRVYSAASSASVTTAGAATVTASASAASTGATNAPGAATVTAAAPLAASSSTSTSGTAAVGTATALAGTGSANTKWTWADLVRTGGQAYRFPRNTLTNVAGTSGPSGAAPRSVCVWMRYFALQDSGAGEAAYLGVFSFGGAQSVYFEVGMRRVSGQAQAFTNLLIGGAQTISPVSVDNDWHHIAFTYDGTNIRSYVDGSLVAGPTARTIPFDDTDWQPEMFINPSATTVDAGHFKIWANYTLSAGEVSSEMTNYRPVTAISSLRAYYPMLWANPGWDGSGHGYDISGLTHALDDAPNGPPGTWPPSEATGNTSTAGTAAVSIAYNAASAGNVTTAGAATVSSASSAAASSSTQTAGTAAVDLSYALVPTGQVSTAGSAAVNAAADVAASGQASTSGAVTVPATAPADSAGQATTSGAVTLTAAYDAVPSGQTSTSGAVTASATAPLAASSQTSTSGTAAVTADTGYDAASAGQTATSGTVAMSAAAGLDAAGSTVTGPSTGSFAGTLICVGDTASSGATEFGSAEFPATSSSQTSTSGAALVAIERPLAASGQTSTSGAAAVAAAADLSAAGQTSTDGATRFTLIAGGLSQTSGSAGVAAAVSLGGSGSTSTNGAAEVTLGYDAASAGQTATAGTVVMLFSAPLQATGSCSTFGSAVFDGVIPSTGGGAGRPIADRRMLGALGIRRRIR